MRTKSSLYFRLISFINGLNKYEQLGHSWYAVGGPKRSDFLNQIRQEKTCLDHSHLDTDRYFKHFQYLNTFNPIFRTSSNGIFTILTHITYLLYIDGLYIDIYHCVLLLPICIPPFIIVFSYYLYVYSHLSLCSITYMYTAIYHCVLLLPIRIQPFIIVFSYYLYVYSLPIICNKLP